MKITISMRKQVGGQGSEREFSVAGVSSSGSRPGL